MFIFYNSLSSIFQNKHYNKNIINKNSNKNNNNSNSNNKNNNNYYYYYFNKTIK